MALTQAAIEYICMTIESEAKQAEESAGYQGETSDRGASRMREKLKFWKDGLAGKVPDEWAEINKEHHNLLDPDYQEFLRLKKKFEGK